MLLHLIAGSTEDAETVSAFFQDMRARGLGDPLLVVSDGARGVIKAIETCFPRSARQRCLAHRMRYLAAKVPEDQWPELKARIQACYQAPSQAIARDLAAGVVADYGRDLPSAVGKREFVGRTLAERLAAGHTVQSRPPKLLRSCSITLGFPIRLPSFRPNLSKIGHSARSGGRNAGDLRFAPRDP